MLYLLLIFLIAICIMLIRFSFYLFVSCLLPSKRAPFVSSFAKDLKLMKQLNLIRWKKIVDLWCGSSRALRFFKSEFWLIWEGYDINFFAIILWKLLNRIKWFKINLFWKNFFQADLKKYDYVYIFLLPLQLAYIEDRVFDNINKNCIVISNSFQFKKNKAFDIIKNKKWYGVIYLYKKNI